MTPECERLGLVARSVLAAEDVEALRQIRNTCKDGFAHDTEEITPQAQAAWWVVQRGRVCAWIYWRYGGPAGVAAVVEPIGYGLVRQTDDGRWWTSVAVLPEFAGRGYGGAITADCARRSPGPVYAEARLDNPAAMRLHRESDWEEIGRDDRLASYRFRMGETENEVTLRIKRAAPYAY